jgi:hypothetical protein
VIGSTPIQRKRADACARGGPRPRASPQRFVRTTGAVYVRAVASTIEARAEALLTVAATGAHEHTTALNDGGTRRRGWLCRLHCRITSSSEFTQWRVFSP